MRDQETTYTNGGKQGNLGRYQLLKSIGQGNTGEAWLGVDPSLRRQVAIKMLPPSTQNDQGYIARFQHEVQVLATLRHPHILPIHDCGVQAHTNGQLFTYIVMPYIAGGSLADLLTQQVHAQQRITPSEVLTFLSQAASALDYAHTQGILHRNLKPSNMLLPSAHELLLTDLAITDAPDSDKQLSTTTPVAGTTAYLSPEHLQGNATPASDIYSLALIAFQLLTNQLSFPAGANATQIIRAYQFPPDLPSGCKKVLLRAVAQEPGARYPSANAFVDALQHAFSPSTGKQQMTRRALLIGTGSMASAGLGLWALSSHNQAQTKSPTKVDPDAPLVILQQQKLVQTLLWAPNKNVFVSASSKDPQVKLWNLAQLQPQNPMAFTSSLTRTWPGSNLIAAWAPDGTALAIASRESNNSSKITVLNATLQTPLAGLEQGFQVPAPSVEGLAWFKQRFLVAVWNDPTPGTKLSYLGMWDTHQPGLKPQPARLNQQLTPRASLDPPHALAVTYDGNRIAICTTRGAMVGSPAIVNNTVIWQPMSPGLLHYPAGSTNAVQTLAWPTSGDTLLGLLQNKLDNKIVIWNFPQSSAEFDAPSPSTHFSALAIAPVPGNNLLAAGTQENNIYLWNQSSNIPSRTLNSGSIQGAVVALSWSFDGQWLIASYNDPKSSILIWKL